MSLTDSPELLCLVCNSNVNPDSLTNIFYVSLPHNGESLATFVTKILSTSTSSLCSSYVCLRCYNLFGMLEQAQQTVANIHGEILRIFQSSSTNKSIINGSRGEEVEEFILEDEKLERKHLEKQEILVSIPKLNDDMFHNPINKIENSTVNDKTNNSDSISNNRQSELDACKYNKTNQVNSDFYKTENMMLFEMHDISVVCNKIEPTGMRDQKIHENSQNVNDVPNLPNSIFIGKALDSSDDKIENKKKLLKHTCPTCDKKWQTNNELKAHMRSHSNIRPFMCEKCGQAYKRKAALEIHIMMHNGISPYRCDHCDKCFTQKGSLQRHLLIHTGEMPYQCKLCNKKFIHHTSFNMHVLSHTKQKSYRCDICDLPLLSTSHLKRHMRIHTGEKPHICKICDKSFAERYNLIAHQKIHDPLKISAKKSNSKKKQFRCKNCDASFPNSPSYHEHLKQHNTKCTVNSNIELEPNYNMNGAELLENCVNEVWQSLSKVDKKTES